MSDLAPVAIAVLYAAAILVGISKTALPGIGVIVVAAFASVLPARSSTATLLLLLIVADVAALLLYRRHADWRALLRLAPAVIIGIIVGALFLAVADDSWVRRSIGIILLALVALTLWFRRKAVPPERHGRSLAAGYGSLGGFTTMVANAGGPVMSMYFLASGFQVKAFLGTAAWFFAIVNVVKVPFAVGLGLITPETLLLDLALLPAVILGAAVGWLVARKMNQAAFEWIITTLTIVGALYLIFGPDA